MGAVKKSQEERTELSFQSVALVIGSTGIVGTSLVDILPRDDTPGGPWKVYAVSRRAPPGWSTPPPSPAVTHLQLDLADPAAVRDALTPLTDVTHVFYAAWSSHETEDRNREVNAGMLRNVLVLALRSALLHTAMVRS